jgi:hypothetical protein
MQLEQTMTQRTIPITSPNFINGRTPEKPLDLTAIFGNNQPLALEIGCGIGHFIHEQARKQPEINLPAQRLMRPACATFALCALRPVGSWRRDCSQRVSLLSTLTVLIPGPRKDTGADAWSTGSFS